MLAQYIEVCSSEGTQHIEGKRSCVNKDLMCLTVIHTIFLFSFVLSQMGGNPFGGPNMDAMAAFGFPGPNMNPQVKCFQGRQRFSPQQLRSSHK